MSEESKKTESRKVRRQYSFQEKLELLDDADRSGESIGTVARRLGVSASGRCAKAGR